MEVFPKVLVLGLPTCYETLQSIYSHKFNFINPNSSNLPLHQFIISNHPPSIRAILCSVSFPLTADFLRLFPSLGLVVTTSAGTDHIDLNECRRLRINVAGAGGLFSEDVADKAVALLIDTMRKISAADRYVQTRNHGGEWDFPLGYKISGKRVGIVGLGNIGMEVAKRMESFGCIILYHSRYQKSSVSYPFYSNIVDLATNSNALVVCCALNEQTKHIINREVLLALGKEGFIVNVGRGGLIDENQLVKCLIEGEIGGAGLDVFENEPHVPQELLALDNVVLSPHCAAFTSESVMSLCELVGGNLESFFSNMPLITPLKLD
ncbi:PREDICTED: glyoxylate/hydroxypyruvate reductase HPR3-like isoform X2 [Lupinus angustifolius]|nr:PREDICTED: glyoxylate/hydroxypyruvate reductase HPR3-like isoform X1 [Lupinus angustifolius]XP_019447348.1 PREDICTED: glyoxylate/hydroxypyruvate reductase HPR3-like isoform X2 [Lupinus angustifolius]